MPSFRSGKVTTLLMERPGLQRVEVDLGDGNERAYVLTQLTGNVAVGDRVVVNTTAVELDLGTGGWHVVHWNLERDSWGSSGPGDIMKLRYTSVQLDTDPLVPADVVRSGRPVVACTVHSQVPCVAAAHLRQRPILAMRYSDADGRERHRGFSHHSTTVLELVRATVEVGVPTGLELRDDRHRIVPVDDVDVPALLDGWELRVTSMGR